MIERWGDALSDDPAYSPESDAGINEILVLALAATLQVYCFMSEVDLTPLCIDLDGTLCVPTCYWKRVWHFSGKTRCVLKASAFWVLCGKEAKP